MTPNSLAWGESAGNGVAVVGRNWGRCEEGRIEGFEMRQNIECVGTDSGGLGNEEGEVD